MTSEFANSGVADSVEVPFYSQRAISLALLSLAIIFVAWFLNAPPGLLGKADAIGYAICHRIDSRSFHIGNLQLPLCARCTGIYLGVVLGAAALMIMRRGRAGNIPPTRIVVVLILFIVLMGIDGVNSYMSLIPRLPYLYQPQNWLRLVTGTLNGVAIANLFFPMFTQTLWDDWRDEAGLQSFRELGWVVLAAVVLILLVLSGNEIVLYAFGLISAAGVLLLLACTMTMSFMLMTRSENKARSWRDVIVPFSAGLTIAFCIILLIDILRFALTGTWGGFVIPGAF